MTSHFNRGSEKNKRRNLRKNATKAEVILWSRIRLKQINGFRFRRQYSIDSFIVDFFCPEVKLAIELDGDSHATQEAIDYDAARERHIEQLGVTFLRFTNKDIFENQEVVLNLITDKLDELKERKDQRQPL